MSVSSPLDLKLAYHQGEKLRSRRVPIAVQTLSDKARHFPGPQEIHFL